MAPGTQGKKRVNKGAWTPEEDERLSHCIQSLGPKRWKSVALKAGLNRCGKSCRLRWLNYLRPNIKRGAISEAEEDLILRLHKLLGNRWSLIAGRLPGRTDNEIKNYWNSHLSKRVAINAKVEAGPSRPLADVSPSPPPGLLNDKAVSDVPLQMEAASFEFDNVFDFSMDQGTYEPEWDSKFLELNQGQDHDYLLDWVDY